MQDELITTLHPEGSQNDLRVPVEARVLVRPEICYWKAALNVLIPVMLAVVSGMFWPLYAILGLCMYVLIRLRGIMIWFIRLYQRYASDEIRQACVFEPSCSEYMIVSLKKYGVVRGGMKGIKR